MPKGRTPTLISDDKKKKFADWRKEVGDRELKRGELNGKADEFGIPRPIALKMAQEAGIKLPKNTERKSKSASKQDKDKTPKKEGAKFSGIVHAKGMVIIPEKEHKAIAKAIGSLSNDLEALKKAFGI